jgi:hypothetical protein
MQPYRFLWVSLLLWKLSASHDPCRDWLPKDTGLLRVARGEREGAVLPFVERVRLLPNTEEDEKGRNAPSLFSIAGSRSENLRSVKRGSLLGFVGLLV